MTGQDVRVVTRIVYTDLDGTMVGPRGSFWHTAGRTLTADPSTALLDLHRAGVALVPLIQRGRGTRPDEAPATAVRTSADGRCQFRPARLDGPTRGR